jgi:hypothetical protein
MDYFVVGFGALGPKKGADVTLAFALVHHTVVGRGYPASTVNQNRFWHSSEAVEFPQGRIADHDGVIQLFRFHERRYRFPTVVIHRNADDGQTTVLESVLEVNEPGHFRLAPVTPCGPKIEQHDFAFEVR